MNTAQRQFPHLVAFHFLVVPTFFWGLILLVYVGVGAIPVMASAATHSGPPLNAADNFFAVIGIFIMASQVAWGFGKNPGTVAQNWAGGSHEFLWTRAVDRRVLFWAKLVVFFGICSVTASAFIVPSYFVPGPMKVQLFGTPSDRQFEAVALAAPALDARLAKGKDTHGETLELGRGREFLTLLIAGKVAVVALIALWLSIALRGRRVALIVSAWFLLFLWFTVGFGLMIWGGHTEWGDILETRGQIVCLAREPLVYTGILLALAVIVIWDVRRRYLRPL
jgi:hypothetical protein